METSREVGDGCLVEVVDEFFQLVGGPTKVGAVVGIHVLRASPTVRESTHRIDEGVRFSCLNHFQMNTSDCHTGKDNDPSFESFPSFFHNDGSTQVASAVGEWWLVDRSSSQWQVCHFWKLPFCTSYSAEETKA